jgi:3-oxosteroid 1-dehydrogenase
MSDPSSPQSRVSRRNFMRAAGLGGVAATLGAAGVSVAQGQKWDNEAEVIVVGTGGAAFSAATAALQNGATSVIMLEKAVTVGGTTIKSGGGGYVPNNDGMKILGIKDSREDFLRYCARA